MVKRGMDSESNRGGFRNRIGVDFEILSTKPPPITNEEDTVIYCIEFSKCFLRREYQLQLDKGKLFFVE